VGEVRETPGPAVGDLDLPTVLHALSDPLRLELVAALAERGEAYCGELIGDRVAKSTRSHHMRVLREAGVVTSWYVGTLKYASLRRDDLDARFPGLLDAVIRSVPSASSASSGKPRERAASAQLEATALPAPSGVNSSTASAAFGSLVGWGQDNRPDRVPLASSLGDAQPAVVPPAGDDRPAAASSAGDGPLDRVPPQLSA
jgi:DNA-binding transcriptional ArsR family regulator